MMTRRKIPTVCAVCEKPYMAFIRTSRYCSQACRGKDMSGAGHPLWKGGKTINGGGYVSVSTAPNVRRREHIMIAERALGHSLPPRAVVHHIDEDTTNNRPENLIICENNGYHKLLHARARRIKDTGSLDLKRCPDCNLVKPLSEFYKNKHSWDGKSVLCKSCANIVSKEQYRQKASSSSPR